MAQNLHFDIIVKIMRFWDSIKSSILKQEIICLNSCIYKSRNIIFEKWMDALNKDLFALGELEIKIYHFGKLLYLFVSIKEISLAKNIDKWCWNMFNSCLFGQSEQANIELFSIEPYLMNWDLIKRRKKATIKNVDWLCCA